MASGSAPMKGETKKQWGARMTAAHKRNPQRGASARPGAVSKAALDTVNDW